MDLIKVKAAAGAKCPKEHFPRDYVTDDVAVFVPSTAYYRRRIHDGSLIVQNDPIPNPAAIPEKKKGARK